MRRVMIIPLLVCLLLGAFPGAFAQEAQPGKSEEDNGYAQISIFAKALELIRQDYVDDKRPAYGDYSDGGHACRQGRHSLRRSDLANQRNFHGKNGPSGCDQCFARTCGRKTGSYAAATCNQGDQGIRVAAGRDQNPKCEGSRVARRGAYGAIQDWLCPADSV